MIQAVRRSLTVQYEYGNQLDQQRARGLVIVSAVLLPVLLIYVLFGLAPELAAGTVPTSRIVAYIIVAPLLFILTYFHVQGGRLQLAIWLFIGALYASSLPFTISPVTRSMPALLFAVGVAAGVLMNFRRSVVVLLVLLVTLLVHVLMQRQMPPDMFVSPDTALLDFGLTVITILLSAGLLYVFSGSTHDLSEVSTADIRHFKTIGGFSEVETEDRLLTNALRVIQNDLGYNLGQIFLVEHDGSVRRRVRLGIGQSDITSSTVVNRGNVLIISEVAHTRQPVTVMPQDEPSRRSHLIDSALRALVVPIMGSGQVLGAIDVQSSAGQNFTPNQIDAFQSLGQRLGEALLQARLIDSLHHSLREREEAAASMRSQLAEMQGGSRRLLQSGWHNYLQARGAMIGYDLQSSGGGIVPASDIPAEILSALSRGDVVVEAGGDDQVINAPIILRGEMLGAMSFVVPADRTISDDEIETVRTVANRLGLALENNRLLEQTQAQAQRERKASEVANILLTATSIETLIELAAENFNEALSAINTRIYLEPGVIAEPPAAHGEPV